MSILESKGFPSTRSNRKYLKLETCVRKSDLLGIASLLESSPDLETLVIHMNARCSKVGSSEIIHTVSSYFSLSLIYLLEGVLLKINLQGSFDVL